LLPKIYYKIIVKISHTKHYLEHRDLCMKKSKRYLKCVESIEGPWGSSSGSCQILSSNERRTTNDQNHYSNKISCVIL